MALRPDVEQRLRELAEAENRSTHETVEAHPNRQERDEWTRTTVRRILEEDAELFELLGDR